MLLRGTEIIQRVEERRDSYRGGSDRGFGFEQTMDGSSHKAVTLSRGNSRGAFGRKNLQDLKKAFFVLSTRKTQFLVTKTLKILNWEGS